MKPHVFRLDSGKDLQQEVNRFVLEHNIKAGVLITCVGNLAKAVIRMANAKVIKSYEGSFEIVSLVGTVEKGNSHLHICIADEQGKTIGGHLQYGSVVGFTAEIVIGELDGIVFKREFDKKTGYKELVVL